MSRSIPTRSATSGDFGSNRTVADSVARSTADSGRSKHSAANAVANSSRPTVSSSGLTLAEPPGCRSRTGTSNASASPRYSPLTSVATNRHPNAPTSHHSTSLTSADLPLAGAPEITMFGFWATPSLTQANGSNPNGVPPDNTSTPMIGPIAGIDAPKCHG